MLDVKIVTGAVIGSLSSLALTSLVLPALINTNMIHLSEVQNVRVHCKKPEVVIKEIPVKTHSTTVIDSCEKDGDLKAANRDNQIKEDLIRRFKRWGDVLEKRDKPSWSVYRGNTLTHEVYGDGLNSKDVIEVTQ